jgi:hypothetical protein
MPSAMKIKTNILRTVLVCLGSALCHAQDFSANVVYFDVPRTAGAKSPQAPSKLYVSKDKVRLQALVQIAFWRALARRIQTLDVQK